MRALVLAITVTAVIALPAQAMAGIRIDEVQYDSPGSDSGSNSSVNAEFVVLKNTGSSARSLRGWVVRDSAGHVYRFGSYSLGAGKRVTIHTGSGSNSARHRYWGEDYYVWNNDGDKATLKKPSGDVADTCGWSTGSGWTGC